MGLQKKAKELLQYYTIFQEPFHILTNSLLSLLLPLSFLLLARLSTYNYLLTITAEYSTKQPPFSFLLSLFLSINPAILYALVSVISIATLIHSLTGKITLLSESPGAIYRPRLYTAWILLCALQICVGLGVEGGIAAGMFEGSGFDIKRDLLSRFIFFFGLHETMIHWSRTVVTPVVDDTIFGAARDEKWLQRVSTALSYGTLWWWKLRNEVESLAFVAEAKIELSMDAGVANLIDWWLYYLTVTIGMVRIVKAIIWAAVILLFQRVRRNSSSGFCDDEPRKTSSEV